MTTTPQTTTDPLGDWFHPTRTNPTRTNPTAAERMGTERPGVENADTCDISAEPSDAEFTDAEVEAVALEFERHEQFQYGDDDQPRCECGFRLEEAPNGSPVPSLRMHQARAALVAARTAAHHE